MSTKCDGSSATFFRPLRGGELVVCSCNWALRPGPNPVWHVAETLRLSEVLPPGMAIQGELCGPGIQKNRLGLASVELRVFSVYEARECGKPCPA